MERPLRDFGSEEERRAERLFERRLSWSLALLVAIVILIQWAMRSQDIRRLLNESIRMEGLPLSVEVRGLAEPARPWLDWPPSEEGVATGMLYLRVLTESRGEAWIVLNGRPVRTLPPEGAAVTVRDGDRVEVLSLDGETGVLVSGASSNVVAPKPGTWAAGRGCLEISTVEIR